MRLAIRLVMLEPYQSSISVFEQLLSLSTEQQLNDLAAHHKNGVVRLYAFQALKRKKSNISEALVQQFQNDNTKIKTLNGCQGDEKTINFLSQ